jgi:hypothetical protein
MTALPGQMVYPSSAGTQTVPGNDSYAKLLLHFDGADGTTTTTDASSSGKTGITFVGTNCSIQSAQKKFGVSSLRVATAASQSAHLTMPYSADFDFGAPSGAINDFTVECWAYHTATPSPYEVFMGGAGVGWQFGLNYGGSNQLNFWTSGNYRTLGLPGGVTPSNNAWHHYAVVRSGTTFTGYVDGVVCPTVISADSTAVNLGAGNALWIGGYVSTNVIGYMDEVRISKGLARWTAAFTPPAFPYG